MPRDGDLTKRAAGTPLSEAEIEQRREAARARWRKVGVAVGGAVAVAAAVAGGLAFRRGKIRAAKRLYRQQASDTYKAIHRLMEGKARAAEVNHPIHGKISFSRGRDDPKSNGSLGHVIARRRQQGVPEAQINRLIRQIPRAVTRGKAEQRGNSPLVILHRGQKVVFKPEHKKTNRVFGFRTTYEITKGGGDGLTKRTPGAPLSDAEIRQRREAAKARWRKAAGARLKGAQGRGERIVYRGAPGVDRAPQARDHTMIYVSPHKGMARGYARGEGSFINVYGLAPDTRLIDLGAGNKWETIRRASPQGERFMRREDALLAHHLESAWTRQGPTAMRRSRHAIMREAMTPDPEVLEDERNIGRGHVHHVGQTSNPHTAYNVRRLGAQGTQYRHLRLDGDADSRHSINLVDAAPLRFLYARGQGPDRKLVLGKRTPGTPLSEAEHQQRKDAARARWATAGATLAGAAAGAALANREVRRRQREARTEMRRAKAETIGAEVARNRRVEARMEAVKAAAEKRIRTGWPVPLYRKVQEHEIHVARRDLRRLPAEFVNFDVDGKPIFAPLDQEEAASQARRIADARRELDALENARPPRRVPVSATEARVPKQHSRKIRTAKADAGLTPDELARVQAGQSRAAMQAQILQRLGISPEEAARRAEAAEAELARQRATAGAKKGRPAKSAAPKPAAPKRKKVAEKRIIPVGVDRSIQELERKVPRRASVRRVKGVPDSKGLARIRDGLRLRFNDFHYARLVREGRRHGEQMKQARAAARGRYAAIMARMPNRRVRFAAMGAGALVGGAALGLGTYAIDRMRGVEKLAKADDVPRDPAEELLDAGSEAEQGVGERLAEVFRRLRDAPASELLQPGADLLAQIERGMRRATAPIANAMAQGAKTAPVGADVMSDEPMSLVFTFDARNPRVERFIREYREQRVRELTEEQADTVRDTVFQAALTGASPDEIARQVRQSIGLTTSQAAQVRNYRAQLEALDPRAMQRSLRDKRFDRTVSRAITTGTPLSPEQVDKMVDAYHRRYLAYRAMTIARTEGVGAANNGHVMAMKEWLAQNPNYTVVKTWIATKDERTRPDHKALHGQESVGIDTPFRCENGDMIRWPGDQDAPARQTINCRCTLSTRIIPRVQSLSAS